MSLTPVLTAIGRDALIAAQLGSTTVVLEAVSFGSTNRDITGDEVALASSFLTAPISSSEAKGDGQIDLGVLVTGATSGMVADHAVREIGFFDQDGRLIFYWSTPTGSLGSITPTSDYALVFSVVMAAADAEVITIVDEGAPWDVLFEARVAALEANLTPTGPAFTAVRNDSWRILYLALG